ncbi:MAG TPA: complex I subunit 1 family protein [Candidatus Limnocylindrales bacterium]|nr:complex I subunit 1 family protein [Candidatus Limnocylindrales bacterium]
MTAVARAWGRLTLPGKVVFTVVPLLVAMTAGLIVAIAIFGGAVVDVLASNMEIVRFVGAATIILVITIPIAFLNIFLEMKVIAFMNLRVGPDRVGPWGTALSVVHGLKVLMKEDFTPTGADSVVFTWAPVVTYAAAVMTVLVLPFAPGLYGQDFNIGLLYFFAMGGLGVVGLLMGGWASYNKYSLLGGLRSAAQIISYEIPLTLSVVGLLILAGTMSLNTIVEQQSGSIADWYVFRQPLGFIIFFIAATAEGNRTPFDLTEADSEIVAGFATEYSGMRFGFFFFAEYVNVFILSALTVVLFLGGWNAPFEIDPILDWIAGLLPGLGITTPVTIPLDLGGLGLPLLFLIALIPPIGTLLFAAPFYLLRSSMRWWVALIIGFLLFNVVAGGLVFAWAYVSFDWVAGLVWFLVKAFAFVFLFVWMRGTLPRVRIDQLMGFAWKWLLPAALLNLFVTAFAVVLIGS